MLAELAPDAKVTLPDRAGIYKSSAELHVDGISSKGNELDEIVVGLTLGKASTISLRTNRGEERTQRAPIGKCPAVLM